MNTMHKHTILVVDDEEMILSSLNRLLRKEYNVLLAQSAADGLKLMQEHEVHVTITDQRMPGMNGVEFSSIIKGEYPDAIRMLLTGYTDLESVIAAINSGSIYRYMVKPWDPDELLIIVREACAKYDLIVENRLLTKQLMDTNAALEERVKERTARLSRTNAVITALNHVTIQLQSSLYLDQVNATLESELAQLNLRCLIALQEHQSKEDDGKDIQWANDLNLINGDRCHILLEKIASFKQVSEKHQAEFVANMREWADEILAEHTDQVTCCVERFADMSANSKGAILPMYTHQGFIGALILWGENLDPDDLEPLTMFANQVAVEIENARFLESLKILSETDALTGVFNRRKIIALAHNEFNRAQRLGRNFSVVMVDIDKFKQVNDTYGHAVGDHVLRFVAAALRYALRKDVDSIGRFGGDEFVALLPEADAELAKTIVDRLQSSVESSPLNLVNGPDQICVSLGFASLTDSTKSLEEMLDQADQKMYRSKRSK